MKKITGIIMSVALALALLFGITNKTEAATIRGKVEATKVTISERGASASVTYTFTSMDGEINGLGGEFTWVDADATLDGPPVVDNIDYADWGLTGDKREFTMMPKNPSLPTASITFNFKNILPEGSTKFDFPVEYTFHEVDPGEVEFYDATMQPMLIDEVIYDTGSITLELPISVSITNKVSELKQGATKTFTTELENDADAEGVDWSITGNTSTGTTINSAGLLTIGADETIGSNLVITATSVADDTKKDTVTVKVTDKNLNIDVDGNGTPDLNIDTDGDGEPDLNIDTDGNGTPDLNIDVDGDGKPDLNIDVDGDGKPDLNIDTNTDGEPDVNVVVNPDGSLKEPVEVTDKPNLNIDTDKDGKPDLNIDTDGDGKPDLNIDTDNNGKPDINVVVNPDGSVKNPVETTDKPNLNIDTDGDLNPDLNIDVNGDGKADVNIDTDANGEADKNIIQEADKNKPNYVEPGTKNPIYNVDTDDDGKPDYNFAYELLDTEAALAILAKVEVLDRKLYTSESLASMDAFVDPVTTILDTNGIARVVAIEAHVDQASLDQATKNLVDAYNALVLIKTTTNVVTNTPGTNGNKVTQTGMELPVMGLLSLMVSGSAIVLRRKYIK